MDHKFNVSIAEKYGMAEAVLLEGLSFWCMSNKANGRNIKGGLAYTFNSIKALHDCIRTCLKRRYEPLWQSSKKLGSSFQEASIRTHTIGRSGTR